MFGKKTSPAGSEKVETIIGKNTAIQGTLKVAEGTIRIDGHFTGQIETRGNLVLGETGRVEANISAGNVTISGEIKGNLAISGQLYITSTGKVYGDIETKNLIIEEGGSSKANPR